jgi:uncharacterized membrane protein
LVFLCERISFQKAILNLTGVITILFIPENHSIHNIYVKIPISSVTGEPMKKYLWRRKGLIAGMLLCIIFVSLASVSADKNEQHSTTSAGIYLVFAGGHCTLMGCSLGFHLSPLWFQSSSGWVSYGFSGATIIIINGAPSVQISPRIYMEGFKGFAPGSVLWGIKSLAGRIRIIGVCTNIEIH